MTRFGNRAIGAAVVAALVAATYSYYGYDFPVWPQPGFMDDVLRLRGFMPRDWYTSLPPQHWVFAHALSAVPGSMLGSVLVAIWTATYIAVWTAFVLLARSLRLSWTTTLGIGLVAIPTSFAGVGDSAVVFGYVYPNEIAFACILLAVASIPRDRPLAFGVALGVAVAVHPGFGVLGVLALVPAAALRWRRLPALAGAALPLLLLAALPIAVAIHDQAGGSSLSSQERYRLMAIVRIPHHLLYSAFTAQEWLQTAVWGSFAAILLFGVHGPMRRISAAVVGTALALMLAGALAAEAGGPLPLVELQTSRISALLVALGVLGAGVGVERASGLLGRPGLVVAAALVPAIGDRLAVHAAIIQRSVTAAFLCVIVVVGGWLATRYADRSASLSSVALAAACGVYLVHLFPHPVAQVVGYSPDYRAVAALARESSGHNAVVMTPPQLDGFRTLSRRAIVVDFGSYRFGSGDREWVRRMVAVTNDPRIVSPALGHEVSRREALMAADYQRVVTTRRSVVCRYGVALVLARRLVHPPAWLQRVGQRGSFELLRVRRGACAR